jgi:hypothetical protein
MRVQRGKDELLPPAEMSADAVSFDFEVTVDLTERPNFLGKYAQGPKDQRFIYVNSGTYAGETHSCWGRRAKISLMTVTREQIEEVINTPGARLEAVIMGRGRDGGPMCASVPVIGGWKVVKK